MRLIPATLETLLNLEHRYERNHKETRERMTWLRQAVVDLLNPALSQNGEIGRGRDSNSLDNIKPIQGGTDPEYAIRRLKRDRPDLAERVILGEISPHQAAIQAGFRKRTLGSSASGARR